jgi:hypothetical protein
MRKKLPPFQSPKEALLHSPAKFSIWVKNGKVFAAHAGTSSNHTMVPG